jgi:hypothetical protein
MEIRPVPATLAQISRNREGRMVHIEDDVQGVANDLHEIDSHLRLRYSEAGGYFVVYLKTDADVDEGDGHLVLTAQDCDQRIVQRIRRIMQSDYDYMAELDKAEAKAKEEKDAAWSEKIGPIAERLAFAMRKELGYDKSSVVIPRSVA